MIVEGKKAPHLRKDLNLQLIRGVTVMTQWSVKMILVCSTDLFRKTYKIDLYLVCILSKSLYFQKCWETI